MSGRGPRGRGAKGRRSSECGVGLQFRNPQEYLLEFDEADLVVAMRQRENTGRPLGDEPFVKRLGELLGRDLLPRKRGPKGKRKVNN